MLKWAAIFFVLGLVAAVLGFGGIVAAVTGVAQILFYIFLVMFLVTVVTELFRGSP